MLSVRPGSAPLLLTGVQPRNLALARAMRAPEHIVVDAGHKDGVRMRDYGRFGALEDSNGNDTNTITHRLCTLGESAEEAARAERERAHREQWERERPAREAREKAARQERAEQRKRRRGEWDERGGRRRPRWGRIWRGGGGRPRGGRCRRGGWWGGGGVRGWGH